MATLSKMVTDIEKSYRYTRLPYLFYVIWTKMKMYWLYFQYFQYLPTIINVGTECMLRRKIIIGNRTADCIQTWNFVCVFSVLKGWHSWNFIKIGPLFSILHGIFIL